jgi:hypothetical protein
MITRKLEHSRTESLAHPEQRIASATTEDGWPYKFDFRSNNTVQKWRSLLL